MARRLAWLKLAVAVLTVLVGVGASLPTYARLLGGEPEHACHCEARGGHAHCACPKCFPELSLDDDGSLGDQETMTGRCGDDDPGWRTLSTPSVPANVGYAVLPAVRTAPVATRPSTLPPSQWLLAPDPRPPRA